MTPRITLIAAVARNGVIGKDGQLPWRLPADLKHFKKNTLGKPVLMGRKTFASIGRPLPGRLNLVLSRQPGLRIDGCQVVACVDEALRLAAESGAEELMVAGGAEVYRQLIDRAERLLVTEVDAEIEGDASFPVIDAKRWIELESQERNADARNPFGLKFVNYKRRLNNS